MARSLARQMARPITGRKTGSIPGWMLVGACSLMLGVEAAVGVEAGMDVSLTCLSSNRQALVTLKGGMGQWHRIEASTNLFDWRALTNLCQTNPTSAWVDAGATNFSQRFYRSQQLTPLDVYVATPDTNYGYTLLNTIPGPGETTFVLEMRSQAWLTTNDVNRTLWKHWLIIVKPTGVTNTQSLLFIDGGSNPGSLPASADPMLIQIALDTKTIVADLKMVPNEPLVFAGETINRTEDAIIAYSWDKYLRTGDPRWPARLPMTKAAVRAMDTVTAFCGSAQGGGVNVGSFVVAGGSKRGWTTWTTGAVDQRVEAIIPLVIDVLNVQTSFLHHYAAYGFWAPAVQDYVDSGIMDWLGTPQMAALMDIEDPYQYRRRLTIPKFIINDTGDQFFLPDSSQFYFDDLPGVKYLRYIPNTDHSLDNSDAPLTLEACYQAVLAKAPLPQFTWSLQSSNSVRVVAEGTPIAVKLWQATNPDARDFRMETIGPAWQDSTLTKQGDGVYVGTVPVPAHGWTGFFVELTYPGSGVPPYKFTTRVYVVPDTLPYHFTPSVPIFATGDNSLGQVGPLPEATNVIAIAAGAWHSLALSTGGGVIAWGDDWDTQCDVPPNLGQAVKIAAGGYHSLALRADRTVMGWGANDYGQAAPPAALSNVIAIAAGTWHSLALRTDGTVVGWGDNSWGQTSVPTGLANVTAVAAGGNHSLALRADGTVLAWGENTDAQGNYAGQSSVPYGLSNVVAISAGEYHSLALQKGGGVVAWGDDTMGQCSPPPGLSPVAALAGGGAHSVAALTNGSLVAWGNNQSGQCNLPTVVTNAVAIAAGNAHTLVLLSQPYAAPHLITQRR
jgi:PhoPQ-activated pathogenicity-related protein